MSENEYFGDGGDGDTMDFFGEWKDKEEAVYEIDTLRMKQTEEAEKNGIQMPTTGIFVRAKGAGGKFHSTDILLLTRESLLAWLKKDGGDNKLAEDTVGILTGHGRLHDYG